MMISNDVFSAYSGCVQGVYGLSDYAYAPPITSVGSVSSDNVYNSAYYSVQPNFPVYPVISVEEGGTTYYYHPYVYYAITYVPVAFYYQVLEVPCAPEASWSDELTYSDGYSDQAGEVPLCHYAAPEIPSEAVTSFEVYYVEEDEHLNDAPFNIDDKKKKEEDNGASSLGQNHEPKSMNPDCVDESSAYKKFCSEIEERRKILGASSKVEKTFVNRGIPKDLASYTTFCRSVEDRIKENSSPGKKSSSVKESSAYRKFCSGIEDRRKILDSSCVRKKTYVNRGIVSDPSAYRKFCRSAEDKIKKIGPVETSSSSEVKRFIAKERSTVGDVFHEENSQKFMDMILSSSEYFHVRDNIENPKKYSDVLYRQALNNNPRRNNTVLMEILPSIVEESSILDDVTADISCGDVALIERQELVSDDEITKQGQPKGRFKAFRKWLSRTFCSCFKTKDPP